MRFLRPDTRTKGWLEIFDLAVEVDEVDESDPVLALKHARALSGAEDQSAVDFFVAVEVGVSMETKNVVGGQEGFEVQWIVGNEDGLPRPSHFEGAIDQLNSMPTGRALQARSLPLVIVPVDAVEGHGQGRERIENLGLGDIAGMYHAIHSASLKNFDDPLDTGQVVVCVAKDAD